MAFRNKISFIILGIVAQLFFFGGVRADELRPRDNVTEQETVTGPEQHDMSLVSFDPWVIEGELMGAVAAYVYKDVSTARAADYWELCDKEGNVLAVSWFDRFGIRRTAVDRGIVEEKDELEGAFVVFIDGDSV